MQWTVWKGHYEQTWLSGKIDPMIIKQKIKI